MKENPRKKKELIMTRKIRDNGAEASIHFQKAEAIAFYHNSREAFKPETSHPELEKMNECDKTAEEARALFEELSAQGDENFQKNCGRRTNMKAENKLWESVMNLRGRHTMADVQRVNEKIQKITGFIPVQTSIHRDEGHFDEKTGDFIQNIHAQTLWLTQNPEDGKSLAYLLFGRKDIYRQIQDIVAEELGMTRGQSAEITGAKHFRNMRDFKQMKRAESKLNKEWEAKLEANNKEWEQKKAEWERKQAEREAKREEWEKKIPEIIAARERNEKFMNDKVDWECIKQANKYFNMFNDISNDLRLYPNPNENFLTANAKNSLASVFRLFGSVTQLAAYLLTRREAQEQKMTNAITVYKINENLQKCVNIVANDTSGDHQKIAEKIRNVMSAIPQDKQLELIDYALLHAPNEQIKSDIRAIIDGDFEKIGKTAVAQTRIDEKEMRRTLREYAEEARKIKEELREMEEENRILNAAERAILKQKGAQREQYAEQEAENKTRLDELKTLRQQVKDLKKTIDEQKQTPDKDAKTIAELTDKIAKMTEQIAQITAENVKKQKELETAKIITPQMLEAAFEKIDELEAARQTAPQMPPKGAFDIIDELEEKLKEREEQKPEKPEPEPIAKKADDNLNIYGYSTPKPEPRRRFDYERKIDDRPKYVEPEPEPVKQPEEPRDEWQEIEEAMKKWKKEDSVVEKSLLGRGLLLRIEHYEKNGGKMSEERQNTINRYRFWLSYDPLEAEREAQKNAETMRKLADMNREREQKRQQTVEIETAIKYDDVRGKNVKQEDETRQRTLKKRKDELEMGR
jgi:mobilization protein